MPFDGSFMCAMPGHQAKPPDYFAMRVLLEEEATVTNLRVTMFSGTMTRLASYTAETYASMTLEDKPDAFAAWCDRRVCVAIQKNTREQLYILGNSLTVHRLIAGGYCHRSSNRFYRYTYSCRRGGKTNRRLFWSPYHYLR